MEFEWKSCFLERWICSCVDDMTWFAVNCDGWHTSGWGKWPDLRPRHWWGVRECHQSWFWRHRGLSGARRWNDGGQGAGRRRRTPISGVRSCGFQMYGSAKLCEILVPADHHLAISFYLYVHTSLHYFSLLVYEPSPLQIFVRFAFQVSQVRQGWVCFPVYSLVLMLKTVLHASFKYLVN